MREWLETAAGANRCERGPPTRVAFATPLRGSRSADARRDRPTTRGTPEGSGNRATNPRTAPRGHRPRVPGRGRRCRADVRAPPDAGRAPGSSPRRAGRSAGTSPPARSLAGPAALLARRRSRRWMNGSRDLERAWRTSHRGRTRVPADALSNKGNASGTPDGDGVAARRVKGQPQRHAPAPRGRRSGDAVRHPRAPRPVVPGSLPPGVAVSPEAPDTPHGHLICHRCGRIAELELTELDRHLLTEISGRRPREWEVDGVTFSVTGECPRCREGKR